MNGCARLSNTTLEFSQQKNVELALEEAIVNVISHAYTEKKEEITLICRLEDDRQIEFDVCDSGPEFNPLTRPLDYDPKASLEERKPGGLGLQIIHQNMDALFYRREDNQNIFTMIKNINLI